MEQMILGVSKEAAEASVEVFGLNRFNLHSSVITIVLKVAHVGKEAFGSQVAHSRF